MYCRIVGSLVGLCWRVWYECDGKIGGVFCGDDVGGVGFVL